MRIISPDSYETKSEKAKGTQLFSGRRGANEREVPLQTAESSERRGRGKGSISGKKEFPREGKGAAGVY